LVWNVPAPSLTQWPAVQTVLRLPLVQRGAGAHVVGAGHGEEHLALHRRIGLRRLVTGERERRLESARARLAAEHVGRARVAHARGRPIGLHVGAQLADMTVRGRRLGAPGQHAGARQRKQQQDAGTSHMGASSPCGWG
jgi:hypothetical protein